MTHGMTANNDLAVEFTATCAARGDLGCDVGQASPHDTASVPHELGLSLPAPAASVLGERLVPLPIGRAKQDSRWELRRMDDARSRPGVVFFGASHQENVESRPNVQ